MTLRLFRPEVVLDSNIPGKVLVVLCSYCTFYNDHMWIRESSMVNEPTSVLTEVLACSSVNEEFPQSMQTPQIWRGHRRVKKANIMFRAMLIIFLPQLTIDTCERFHRSHLLSLMFRKKYFNPLSHCTGSPMTRTWVCFIEQYPWFRKVVDN